jgi:hypothetical protein
LNPFNLLEFRYRALPKHLFLGFERQTGPFPGFAAILAFAAASNSGLPVFFSPSVS